MDQMTFTLSLLIVIITGLISWQAFQNMELKSKALFRPVSIQKNNEWYRFLTHGFIHADFMHLGVNMFVLWQFGGIIETVFAAQHGPVMGRVFFLALYLLGIIVASIPSFFKHRNNYHYSALGASGAVSGIVFSYILFAPWDWLLLFFIIPVPGIVLGIGYLLYSSYMGKKGNDNIGHDAHFYGAVFGFLFTIIIHPDNLNIFLERLMQGPGPLPF